MAGGDSSIKLYLGNLAFDLVEEDLLSMARQCGNVLHLSIRRWPDTNRSRGFAHVEYRTEEEALALFNALDGRSIRGRTIRMDWCDDHYRKKYPDVGTRAERPPRRHESVRPGRPDAPRRPHKLLLHDGEEGPPPSSLSSSSGSSSSTFLAATAAQGGRPQPSGDAAVALVDVRGALAPVAMQISESMSLLDLKELLTKLRALVLQAPEAAREALNGRQGMAAALQWCQGHFLLAFHCRRRRR
eukprot:GHVT01001603.1.p1 GENE.GHVT01001603.1~~GHVT01001603.1.p1  ORF type:complete len:243 (-),score=71.88 GHVT01001603.1:401-1129(-)